MVTFPFLDRLFDENQFQSLAEGIIGKYLSFCEDYYDNKYDTVWDNINPEEVYSKKKDVTLLEFCKSFEYYSTQLRNDLINQLYTERLNIITQLEEELFKNSKSGEKLLGVGIGKLEKYITSYSNKNWLTDKEYILEEIKKIKTEVLSLNKNKMEMDNTKLVWHGKIGHLGSLFNNLVKQGYLKESTQTLTDFILSNFVDEESNKIAKGSVYKTLIPGGRLSKTFDYDKINPKN